MVASANGVDDVSKITHTVWAQACILFTEIELYDGNTFDILVLDVVHDRLGWVLSE